MAIGVPINSLAELMALREIENKNSDSFQFMQGLTQSVARGIEEQRVNLAEKAKRDQELEMFEQVAGSDTKVGGGLIKSASYDPINKKTSIKYSTKTDKQKLDEEKLSLEIDELRRKYKAPSIIMDDAVSSVLDLDTNSFTDAIPAIKATKITSTTNGNTPIESEIVIPKYGETGRSEGFEDLGVEKRKKEIAAGVEISKAVATQQEKASELAGRSVQRATIASGTAFDEVLRFQEEQYEKFGVTPGQAFGWVEKLTPKQLNRYKASATGAGREAAATVGVGIIPAARAVKMVDIFAESTAEIGNTIEGNAANASASMSNIWGTAIANNIDIEMNDSSKQKIKDLVKDPLTGKFLSEIEYPEYLNAIQRATEDFKLKSEENYIMKAYNTNKNLLSPETVIQIESRMSDDDLLRRIEELRSKI